ncbi:SGNH/GDSL hydrolase family protein [Rhizobacter sp. OV335]|uniref:SGNH/GDSL hydrolase family protein n=1 Tax=Rhizobacter sp. OV335 TaxID=1500264 RepID=UPI00091E2903|nr:SGNH/GDSL hydrolase family protein [Rhizobacter sp. OV335]SHN15054.1 Lysophospholipase L1 [Rhizobacter sp. OV335]
MTARRTLRRGLAATVSALACVAALPADAGTWIPSWTASPEASWGAEFALPTSTPPLLDNQTLRQVVRLSLGGHRVRLQLSNEYGSEPLVIGAAQVALASAPGRGRVVTFGGQAGVIVPPGAPVLSDPVEFEVAPLASLAVSLYFPKPTSTQTFHWDGRQAASLAPGNQVAAAQLPPTPGLTARIFLSAIAVEADSPRGSVVVTGDSITDGNGATMDADTRWPDFLAARLAPQRIAVLNAGISGGRLLTDGMGPSALARFDRDVLMQPHVRSVIVLIGINDISWPGTAFDPQRRPPELAELIAGYRQLIASAHRRGVRVLGATLTPFEGALAGTPLADYFQPHKDALRRQLNAWIRDSGEFDAVIDFDALLRDPAQPSRLQPAFDSGDHLHPGDAGHRAMADAVPLRALLRRP